MKRKSSCFFGSTPDASTGEQSAPAEKRRSRSFFGSSSTGHGDEDARPIKRSKGFLKQTPGALKKMASGLFVKPAEEVDEERTTGRKCRNAISAVLHPHRSFVDLLHGNSSAGSSSTVIVGDSDVMTNPGRGEQEVHEPAEAAAPYGFAFRSANGGELQSMADPMQLSRNGRTSSPDIAAHNGAVLSRFLQSRNPFAEDYRGRNRSSTATADEERRLIDEYFNDLQIAGMSSTDALARLEDKLGHGPEGGYDAETLQMSGRAPAPSDGPAAMKGHNSHPALASDTVQPRERALAVRSNLNSESMSSIRQVPASNDADEDVEMIDEDSPVSPTANTSIRRAPNFMPPYVPLADLYDWTLNAGDREPEVRRGRTRTRGPPHDSVTGDPSATRAAVASWWSALEEGL